MTMLRGYCAGRVRTKASAFDVGSRKQLRCVHPNATRNTINSPTRRDDWICAQKRRAILGSLVLVALARPGASSAEPRNIDDLASLARDAYNRQNLTEADRYYSEIVSLDPGAPVWLERRGQVRVDMKRFEEAIADFTSAETQYQRTIDPNYVSLGLLSNRALAHEGLYQWDAAITDYNKAVRLGADLGYSIPYVLNSRGNCHASLAALAERKRSSAEAHAAWQDAQQDYAAAATSFQRSKNLPGAIFASSNAALMSAQLGNDSIALRELRTVARRAPGSIDMRAAMAAIYWAAGEEEKAEETWGWACSKINSGQLVKGGPVLDSCDRYEDSDWLERIRRWPPVMVVRMKDFLSLKSPTAPATI